MVQRYLDRLVAVAALAAVMGGCLTPFSQADAQGTIDAAAKRKVEQFLGPAFRERQLFILLI
jgi:hypothetical protein